MQSGLCVEKGQRTAARAARRRFPSEKATTHCLQISHRFLEDENSASLSPRRAAGSSSSQLHVGRGASSAHLDWRAALAALGCFRDGPMNAERAGCAAGGRLALRRCDGAGTEPARVADRDVAVELDVEAREGDELDALLELSPQSTNESEAAKVDGEDRYGDEDADGELDDARTAQTCSSGRELSL